LDFYQDFFELGIYLGSTNALGQRDHMGDRSSAWIDDPIDMGKQAALLPSGLKLPNSVC
jgi:hypothetical protein